MDKAGQKYTINQYSIDTILTWIRSDEIAIPEIQRPFVWKATKVRDLMDSLYNGYPVGYLIAWRNPDVKLKDGNSSQGKRILIDGQQRITALNAAVLGEPVVNENYRRVKIQIAFHPLEERFEVFNPAIEKDMAWLPDIAAIINGELSYLNRLTNEYCQKNNVNADLVFGRIDKLRQIKSAQLGLIELEASLDIEIVTEIFIRINSEGVVLSQADFVMSKIAASEKFDGVNLRKAIDYFCHLSIAPEFYTQIQQNDTEFAHTDYFRQMSWLKDENDDLYDPGYTDLIRVAFISEFERGRLADLVSLLSGRNFETRTFEEQIAEESFARLKRGVMAATNETSFKRFLMIIKSAGFITAPMIRSMNALNFAYAVYLKLRSQGHQPNDIESTVRRWYVMSMLTGRHSISFETQFDFDIKQIAHRDFKEYLKGVEDATLSDAFWNVALVQGLESSSTNSPYLYIYFASQVKAHDKGFLSKAITVQDLIIHRGDIHHIFPSGYLKKQGRTRSSYNQLANYVYMQSEINIRIGDKAPKAYFDQLIEQCNGGPVVYGGITDMVSLKANLAMHAIPESVFEMTHTQYDQFLEERRILIAKKMRDYYFSL